MKRYYVSDTTGVGTDEDEYRPLLAKYSNDWAGPIPSNPVTGHPTQDWVLVACTGVDQSALVGVDGIDPLPDNATSTLLADMSPDAIALIDTALTARGISTSVRGICVTYADLLARLQFVNFSSTGPTPVLSL